MIRYESLSSFLFPFHGKKIGLRPWIRFLDDRRKRSKKTEILKIDSARARIDISMNESKIG